MSLTRAESAALPREQQIANLKAAKGGTWHDDWAPYCMVCTSMARMAERDYGFECIRCRNQIGWDLCRLTDSPLNETKSAEGGPVSGCMVGMMGAFTLPYGDGDPDRVRLTKGAIAGLIGALSVSRASSQRRLENEVLDLMCGVDDVVVYRGDPRQLPPVPPAEAHVQETLRELDYTDLAARVIAKPIRQVIVVGHGGDPWMSRAPGEPMQLTRHFADIPTHKLATLIKPPSKTDPWAKRTGGKGKRRPLFRR